MKHLTFCLLILFITSCSTTADIQRSWVSPDIKNKNLSGTIVVVVAENDEMAILYEKELLKELNKQGVRAEARHNIITGKVENDEVIAYAQANNFDTILVSQYVGSDSQDIHVRGKLYLGASRYPGRVYTIRQTPSYYTTSTYIMLVATLYETSSKEKLWDAVSTSQSGGMPEKLFLPFIESFITQLKKDLVVK